PQLYTPSLHDALPIFATARTIPRSLKEPVGFAPSNFSHSSSTPTQSARRGARTSGVAPSPSESSGVASVTGRRSRQRVRMPGALNRAFTRGSFVVCIRSLIERDDAAPVGVARECDATAERAPHSLCDRVCTIARRHRDQARAAAGDRDRERARLASRIHRFL